MSSMDQDIYNPIFNGSYATRRVPKGGALRSLVAALPATPANSRPAIADMSFYVSAAPHAAVIRKDYEVPVGRRARVQGLSVKNWRTAAGTTGSAGASIGIRRKATGDITYPVFSSINNAAVGAESSMQHSGEIELFEGDKIEMTTSDLGVGGTVDYRLEAVIIEYDANASVNASLNYQQSVNQQQSAPQSAPVASAPVSTVSLGRTAPGLGPWYQAPDGLWYYGYAAWYGA